MSIESCQAFPASQGIDFLGKIHCLDSATAQWIRKHLPSCHPGFESKAHHLRFELTQAKIVYAIGQICIVVNGQMCEQTILLHCMIPTLVENVELQRSQTSFQGGRFQRQSTWVRIQSMGTFFTINGINEEKVARNIQFLLGKKN